MKPYWMAVIFDASARETVETDNILVDSYGPASEIVD